MRFWESASQSSTKPVIAACSKSRATRSAFAISLRGLRYSARLRPSALGRCTSGCSMRSGAMARTPPASCITPFWPGMRQRFSKMRRSPPHKRRGSAPTGKRPHT